MQGQHNNKNIPPNGSHKKIVLPVESPNALYLNPRRPIRNIQTQIRPITNPKIIDRNISSQPTPNLSKNPNYTVKS
jgi:hypothetical protein